MEFSFEFVFKHYFEHIYNSYQTNATVLVAMYILTVVAVGVWKGWKSAFQWLTIGYCLLVLYVTVFSRPQNEQMQYCLVPLHSYYSIFTDNRFLLPQVVMNVVMFVPLGVLMGFLNHDWKGILLAGMLFSMIIEGLQLVMMRGTAEVDDVIHNTVGCMIGYGMINIKNG